MTSFVTSLTLSHTHNLALSNSLEFAVKTLPFCHPVLRSSVADDIPFDKSVWRKCAGAQVVGKVSQRRKLSELSVSGVVIGLMLNFQCLRSDNVLEICRKMQEVFNLQVISSLSS